MTYIWLECQSTGCDSGVSVDIRHVDNLTAPGAWTCHAHKERAA